MCEVIINTHHIYLLRMYTSANNSKRKTDHRIKQDALNGNYTLYYV